MRIHLNPRFTIDDRFMWESSDILRLRGFLPTVLGLASVFAVLCHHDSVQAVVSSTLATHYQFDNVNAINNDCSRGDRHLANFDDLPLL
ncbi:MAG: hypothetical protein M2R45_02741 [Verrucomicrobia subdivision 3 bacterium]|nr:hypothetical protein [Limisphaerales bacterium]MCS1414291.1 hypothetical protein [Limisphaerales bacterium]